MIDQELSQADLEAIETALQQPDSPLDLDLLRAWNELQLVPSYTSRDLAAEWVEVE